MKKRFFQGVGKAGFYLGKTAFVSCLCVIDGAYDITQLFDAINVIDSMMGPARCSAHQGKTQHKGNMCGLNTPKFFNYHAMTY